MINWNILILFEDKWFSPFEGSDSSDSHFGVLGIRGSVGLILWSIGKPNHCLPTFWMLNS